MLEFLFNKVAGHACNFIKKRLQHKCFPVKFVIFFFKNTFFYRTPPVAVSTVALVTVFFYRFIPSFMRDIYLIQRRMLEAMWKLLNQVFLEVTLQHDSEWYEFH